MLTNVAKTAQIGDSHGAGEGEPEAAGGLSTRQVGGAHQLIRVG